MFRKAILALLFGFNLLAGANLYALHHFDPRHTSIHFDAHPQTLELRAEDSVIVACAHTPEMEASLHQLLEDAREQGKRISYSGLLGGTLYYPEHIATYFAISDQDLPQTPPATATRATQASPSPSSSPLVCELSSRLSQAIFGVSSPSTVESSPRASSPQPETLRTPHIYVNGDHCSRPLSPVTFSAIWEHHCPDPAPSSDFTPSAPTLSEVEQGDSLTTPACVICMERDAEYALIPCGHQVLCQQCVPRVQQCPVCRSTASSSIKIYTL